MLRIDLILTLPYTINTPLDYRGFLHSQAVIALLAHRNSVRIVLVANTFQLSIILHK